MMPDIKLATTAVILKRDDPSKILLGLRRRDNRWELPGGKIDPGETPEQTILREIIEELGITVKVNSLIAELAGTYRNIPMRVFGFETVWEAGELEMNVHARLVWVTLQEASGYDIVEEDREILAKWEAQRRARGVSKK